MQSARNLARRINPISILQKKFKPIVNTSIRYDTDWATSIRVSRPGVEGYDMPPLTQTLRDEAVKPKLPGRVSSTNYDTHVTVLDNGLRVASEKLFGEFCTVGVIIDAGPRYETAASFPNGITHFMEKFGFMGAYPNQEELLKTLERNGAISDCQTGRDAVVYALSCRRSGLPEILSLLAKTLYRPEFTEQAVEQVRKQVEFEIDDLNHRPDCEAIMSDMLHKAAFGTSSLASPKICPVETLPLVKHTDLYSYLKTFYAPKRTVLTCVGVDHAEFVNMAKKTFESMTPIWKEQPQLLSNVTHQIDDTVKNKWIGGSNIVRKDMAALRQGNDLPELAHVMIGLPSPSFHSEQDFVTSCVLNTLMGGGGSFSSGGPGKGMYSRLYTNVLNQHHFMFSATAYNQSYSDTGIFYIHASSPPENIKEMCTVIANEMLNMAGPCDKQELARAKTQLQSMLFMNLEQRPVLFEDVARQVLSTGKREKAQYYFDRIEAITEDDVRRVATKMLESPVAVAALGQFGRYQTVNPYDVVKNVLNGTKTSLKTSFLSKLQR